MASQYETGHAKNVANFGDLTEFCIGYGPRYNPAKTILTLTNLGLKHAAGKASVSGVAQMDSENNHAENQRMEEFSDLLPYSTRIVHALETTDASPQKIDDARVFLSKLSGVRAGEKKIDKDGKDTSISTSQLSYDNQVEHFYGLLLVVSSEPSYAPNETDLTIDAITAKHAALTAKNKAVAKAETNLSNARIKRNKELYGETTGLVEIAKEVKKYISSVFGANSPEFKQVSGIKFTEPKK